MNVTCSNQMLRTHENSDVFNTLDEIYLVLTKKSKFSFYLILFIIVSKMHSNKAILFFLKTGKA